jgi:hypothetical protein
VLLIHRHHRRRRKPLATRDLSPELGDGIRHNRACREFQRNLFPTNQFGISSEQAAADVKRHERLKLARGWGKRKHPAVPAG